MKKLILAAAILLTCVNLSAQEIVPGITSSDDFRGRVGGAFEWEVVDDL